MFNKTIAIMLLMAATAHAEDETVDMTGESKPAEVTPVAVAGVNSSGAPFTKGMLGLSLPFTLVTNISSRASLIEERVPSIGLLYFVDDKSALDIVLGLNVHRYVQYNSGVPPMGEKVTRMGFAAGVGYRMYKHRNRVATFIEPEVLMEWTNLNDSATFTLSGLGLFGAEVMLAEWASLSGAVGAGLTFGNKFDDIQLATTATLAANLYWK
jgi:hypothetical protein